MTARLIIARPHVRHGWVGRELRDSSLGPILTPHAPFTARTIVEFDGNRVHVRVGRTVAGRTSWTTVASATLAERMTWHAPRHRPPNATLGGAA